MESNAGDIKKIDKTSIV